MSMQPPKIREIIKRLEHDGWKRIRAKGGRRIYRKGNKTVTIHGKDSDQPPKGTWAELKREAEWSQW